MIPIPPKRTHKTLFNYANDKKYFLTDIQMFSVYTWCEFVRASLHMRKKKNN